MIVTQHAWRRTAPLGAHAAGRRFSAGAGAFWAAVHLTCAPSPRPAISEWQEIAPPPPPAAPDTRNETDREYQQRQESFFWGFYPMFRTAMPRA